MKCQDAAAVLQHLRAQNMELFRSQGAAYMEERWNSINHSLFLTELMSFSKVKQTNYSALNQAFAETLMALHVYYVYIRPLYDSF